MVAIPIQALAVRSRKDLDEAAKKNTNKNVTLAATPPTTTGDPKKDELQGVFVVNGKKAIFVPWKLAFLASPILKSQKVCKQVTKL